MRFSNKSDMEIAEKAWGAMVDYLNAEVGPCSLSWATLSLLEKIDLARGMIHTMRWYINNQLNFLDFMSKELGESPESFYKSFELIFDSVASQVVSKE